MLSNLLCHLYFLLFFHAQVHVGANFLRNLVPLYVQVRNLLRVQISVRGNAPSF